MSTSGTYVFSSPQSEQIITDAYERIGIKPDVLTYQQIQTAQRSINFALQSWINRGLNLWTVKQGMIALYNNQTAYNLPPFATDFLEATVRTSVRNLGGTPFSSAGGVASNAFDNNPATACIQTVPNGYISYNWNTAQYAIAMVGVQSNVSTTYTLVCEFSNDNVNWINAITIPAQNYPFGIIEWFIVPVPTLGSLFRVRETGGSTLNIQELYFNTALNDTTITRVSRAEYTAFPNKNITSRPSSFYVDRQINPVVYLYPTPNTLYNNLYFTYIEQMQDIGTMLNNAQVPARFLEALCSNLAHRVGVKEQIEIPRIQILESLAEKEFNLAAAEDRERVPLRIYGDYMQGWTQV